MKILIHSLLICLYLTPGLTAKSAGIMRNTTESDSVLFELEPITVSAMRFPESVENVPFSVSAVDRIALTRARKQLSLTESLHLVPGVFGLSDRNFAQDLRIAIRGFGARSAFGIRGIQVLIDDIPETTPDGQTSLDIVNLGIMQRMEVVRGPVSTVYGNAAGGVVKLYSKEAGAGPYALTRLSAGSYGFRQSFFETGRDLGRVNMLVSGSYNEMEGFRHHSEMQSTVLNSSLRYERDSLSTLHLRLSYENSPKANDPGGLTKEQAETDRRRAASRNLVFRAGEEVEQGRVGLSYRRTISRNSMFNITGYGTKRIFSNRLPFLNGGMVDLDRDYFGGSGLFRSEIRLQGLRTEIQTGIDAARQNDHRRRFDNLEGKRGDKVFNQEERYTTAGMFLRTTFYPGPRWQLGAGGRMDRIMIEADDRLLTDGNNSGKRYLSGVSWMAAVLYHLSDDMHVFGNISTGFEAPALIELTTNPGGGAGLNPDLGPERALNMEIGLKGEWLDRLRFEGSLFNVRISETLLPFELPDTPGRTYYRNAGETRHRGLEAGIKGIVIPGLTFTLAYALSDFTFADFRSPAGSFDGNQLPGIPGHRLSAELFFVHRSGFYLRNSFSMNDRIYADDANSGFAQGQAVVHLQAGMEMKYQWLEAEPYVGLNNIFNSKYYDNIRINAFGGRYFEPAPPFNLYGGISVRFGN